MSCPHCVTATRTPESRSATVALVGNPNVGKSSLFNAACDSRQDVRNAPGTTVEVHASLWEDAGVRLLDLPGTYSLLARTPDEQVASDVLSGRHGAIDLAVVLLDATALPRSLYLLGQVAQAGVPAVAVLTMTDRATAVDRGRLEAALGVPVAALDPRAGTSTLADTVIRALADPPHVRGIDPDPAGDPAGRSGDLPPEAALTRAERLFAWVEDVRRASGGPTEHPVRTRSDRIDDVLLHPWIGVPVFAAMMWAVFQLATSVAGPVMAWAGGLVAGPVARAATAGLAGVGLAGTAVEGLVVDGVIAGVGTVGAFAPLMALMFLAIAILDDSGYLARASFVADRTMRVLGLDGRAILPLIVGFGCNVPALAAVRSLPDARQRIVTAILVPYTSCAARLTVYVMLGTAFFPGRAGTVIFLMYVLSVLLVVLAGLALQRFSHRTAPVAPLLMVLPDYQLPRLRPLLVLTWRRTAGFVLGAGRLIVVVLTAMWVLMAIPVQGDHPLGDVPVRDSLYGAVAEAVAPVFAPAGFDSWQASAALMTGFVAKEVVVGSFAQSFSVDGTEADLGTALRATFDASSGGHGSAAALAFMVFVLAYTPCVATLAEQRRLLGRRVTLAAALSQLTVAWLLATAAFQVLRVVL